MHKLESQLNMYRKYYSSVGCIGTSSCSTCANILANKTMLFFSTQFIILYTFVLFFSYAAIMLTFVQSLYMVSESVGSVDIEVTKQNQVVSEQVLPVSIGLATQGSARTATQGLKYYIFIIFIMLRKSFYARVGH